MITGKTLLDRVSDHWSRRFQVTPERFEQVGSLILPDETFLDSGNVSIYHLRHCACVRMDPALCRKLQLSPGQTLPSILSLPELATIVRLGMRHTARVNLLGIGSYFYLDPQDFIPAVNPLPARLVQLDPHMDAGLIERLCQDCPPAEVEDAEISPDQPDEVIFGHILDGRLLSYAGFRSVDVSFADIGVLTHPEQRRQHLALSGASRLCEWLIGHDLIPMYRVLNTNFASRKIPEALGFARLVEIEVLQVVE